LLFQVVSRRHEKRSLVLTTNLAFRDWPAIFPNAGSAVALIDRLIHHADVLAIEGESYRLREAEQALKKKGSSGICVGDSEGRSERKALVG
jgi:DNA replication protein DnaC